MHEVDCVVKDLDDTNVLEAALIENIQREDLNVIEEANVELKANAIKQGANAVLGYNMNLTTTAFGSKNYVIVSVTGTAVETA